MLANLSMEQETYWLNPISFCCLRYLNRAFGASVRDNEFVIEESLSCC